MTKKKILMLSDSPFLPTGYATITRNVLNRLSDDYECHCISHNYFGLTLKPGSEFTDGEKINFYMHGTDNSKYCMRTIPHLIKKLNIDIFGILLDTFMLYDAGFLQVDTSPAHTFFYYPSDGGGILPLNCDNILKKVNMPIAMAKFGRDQVKKHYNINSEYIPHGYDPKIFYPSDKEKAKAKWGLTGKFVVGTVARNQGRKMMDRTLKAFKLFSLHAPNAVLFMHTDPNDVAQVSNLPELINRYQLNNRIVFSGTTFFNSFDYKDMNDVYNAMDIFFLSTSGEGFGIPTIEAMACGVPQLVTDYTTTKELVTDEPKTGLAIKLAGEKDETPYPHTNEILDGTLTGSWNVERGIMSIYDARSCLIKAYNDKALMEEFSKNCLIKAKQYEWDNVMELWKKALKKFD